MTTFEMSACKEWMFANSAPKGTAPDRWQQSALYFAGMRTAFGITGHRDLADDADTLTTVAWGRQHQAHLQAIAAGSAEC